MCGRDTPKPGLSDRQRLAAPSESGAAERLDGTALLAAAFPGPVESTTEVARKRAPSRPLLQVRCFGRFEVVQDGRPVREWRRDKARALLKQLAVRRGPVLQEVLLDLLWPDADRRLALINLRVTLHALRKALGRHPELGSGGGDYVIRDGHSYLINP